MTLLDTVIADLRATLADLGKDGGQMSASEYDTAQVIRLAPPPEGCEPAISWLLEQRAPDGGWGDPGKPITRDGPTLAAILALHTRGQGPLAARAVRDGLAFLQGRDEMWRELGDDLPVAAELIIPRLLDEATALGLDVPRAQYATLEALGRRRQERLSQVPAGAGTAAAHAWETWGTEPLLEMLDRSGGVGSSPAATAQWLQRAAGRPDRAQDCMDASAYLRSAERSTGLGPGIVPTAHPITSFERIWGLLPLLRTQLLGHPALWSDVRSHLQAIADAMSPDGIGMSPVFMVDGDITAVALSLLHAGGLPVDTGWLLRFAKDDHFYTYPGELQPSITTTAHAVASLRMHAHDVTPAQRWLVALQTPDGRWLSDKWHTSWLYGTSEVVPALAGSTHERALALTAESLVKHQRDDGGWGVRERSTPAETSYAVIALLELWQAGLAGSELDGALRRGAGYLTKVHASPAQVDSKLWTAKDLYCPPRIDRVFRLAATAAVLRWMSSREG